jgi:hypothetical protein
MHRFDGATREIPVTKKVAVSAPSRQRELKNKRRKNKNRYIVNMRRKNLRFNNNDSFNKRSVMNKKSYNSIIMRVLHDVPWDNEKKTNNMFNTSYLFSQSAK